ncbi:hypothetical protein GH714_015113 [Hevea brasiliensis]|uniref:Uncharacterized protein n=1 Tax=Hevea brasiliensis TaxID=3981 RepID=A0A6A6LKW0_HEVBR|nr:hypothetical protein GH714_015113 [Hevea brasiliensis]
MQDWLNAVDGDAVCNPFGNTSRKPIAWKPPQMGKLKCNLDATFARAVSVMEMDCLEVVTAVNFLEEDWSDFETVTKHCQALLSFAFGFFSLLD